MRYQHSRSLGMFGGSCAVEAGCKAVMGQRLKRSGMHWPCNGATGILTLRCQQASGRWEEIWQPANRSGAAWPASDNGTHSDHPRPAQVTRQSRTFLSHTHPAGCTTDS